jgi:hypothetical protein
MSWSGIFTYLSDTRKKIEVIIGKVFLHPAFGFFSSIIGIIAGWLGSHFDTKISAAKFGFTLNWTLIDWNVLAFWLATMLFGVCFSGTFWAQSASASKSNRELHDAIDKLRTLPPKGFLGFYEPLATLSVNIRWNFASTPTVNQLKQAIRIQLECILKIVEKFDDHGGGVYYGANVMLYIDSSDTKFLTNSSVYTSTIKCMESGVLITALAGVLQLQTELSVSNLTGTHPDSNLTALCLPISLQGGVIDLDWLLAGAPLSFADKKVLVYESNDELYSHVDNSANFTPTVKNQLKTILLAQTDFVQALINIPIYDKSGGGPIGVLNIHKNISDNFIADKIALLKPLLGPLVKNLGNLVAEVS